MPSVPELCAYCDCNESEMGQQMTVHSTYILTTIEVSEMEEYITFSD